MTKIISRSIIRPPLLGTESLNFTLLICLSKTNNDNRTTMKKLLGLIAGSMLVFNLSAQVASKVAPASSEKESICAEKKDGKLVVMHNGKELTKNYTTSAGVVIKTDGNIIRKDGTKSMLKEGECVNAEGKIASMTPTDKNMSKAKPDPAKDKKKTPTQKPSGTPENKKPTE
ncbi:MAG: hypothetical protein H6585_02590 [Flavobacteriales bacterium]|nr:hypothetical protein [Flavobacteriales bacterium]